MASQSRRSTSFQALPQVEGRKASIRGEGFHQFFDLAASGSAVKGVELDQSCRQTRIPKRKAVGETERTHQDVICRPHAEASRGKEHRFCPGKRRRFDLLRPTRAEAGDTDQVVRLLP